MNKPSGKKVILCEGRHDLMFGKAFLEKKQIPCDKVKFFPQKESDTKKQLKHAESICLKSFFQDTSPYEILFKSEAGKGKVIRAFNSFRSRLFDEDAETHLILDLDGGDVEQLVVGIKEKIKNSSAGEPLEVTHKIVKENDRLVKLEFSVVVKDRTGKNSVLGSFCITAFRCALDEDAGIKKNDIEELKKNKIRDFLKNDEVVSFFSFIS